MKPLQAMSSSVIGGKMFSKRKVIAVIAALLLLAADLMAYQLSPLNATYDPTGAGSAKVYTIVNDSDSPIAIEVRAEQRIIDIDGNEANQDGSAYFSIQPSTTSSTCRFSSTPR